MAYITYEQYVSFYGAPAVSETEFPIYAGSASDLIDAITQYRIVEAGGISAFPPAMQTMIQKATALQVMYYIMNGLETVMSGQTGKGYTVGKVHLDGVSSSGSGGALTSAQMMVGPAAKATLEQTGLMYRGTPVLGYRKGWGVPVC